MSKPATKRSALSFSLRALLILVTLIGVGLAIFRWPWVEVGDPADPFGPDFTTYRRGWNGKVWGENQRISVAEAIAVNTTNGAWASGEEKIKGTITAGKLADYVVLAEDPHTVDPESAAVYRRAILDTFL